jgi:ABC-type branched-subunit amino acid transport system substrate-binding protein
MVSPDEEINQKSLSCSVTQEQKRKNTSEFILFVLFLFLILPFFSSSMQTFDIPSENEVATSAIVLASSNALSGPAAKLGTRLNEGSQVYFDKINKLGGINGHPILLKTVDDGYEPYKTLKNTQVF